MEEAAKYGFSAPPDVAFILVVPFLVGIVICTVSSILLWRGSGWESKSVVIDY
jgi:hypothetical protein